MKIHTDAVDLFNVLSVARNSLFSNEYKKGKLLLFQPFCGNCYSTSFFKCQRANYKVKSFDSETERITETDVPPSYCVCRKGRMHPGVWDVYSSVR